MVLYTYPEIQEACALSLGRMASEEASRLLEKQLADEKVSDSAKMACFRAMAMIGTSREQVALKKMWKKADRLYSEELQAALNRSLQTFEEDR